MTDVLLRTATHPCADASTRSGDDDLIARYIEPDPLGLGAAEAQIVGHGVSIWALIASLQAVGNQTARAATAYGVDLGAVEAAVRFCCRYQ